MAMRNKDVLAASPMAEFVEDYLAECRSKGLSQKTVNFSYGYPLREVFVPWCNTHGFSNPAELTTDDLVAFSNELQDAGGKRGSLSKHSIWTYVKAVKRFFAWASARDQRVQAEAELPKLPRKLVEILSRDEVKLMEIKAGNERDALIIRILADTGLRVGELINLRTDSVVQRDRSAFLRVRGKGDKERLVPILPSLHRRIIRYSEGMRGKDTTSRRLFLSRRRDGGDGDYKALTESGVQQMVRDVADRAKLGKRVHPHVFRHSAATFMLQRGMDSILVAQVLGHESLQMIQRVYSHLTPLDAHKALASALREDED